MRHESSTVVALVGDIGGAAIADAARSPNVSVVDGSPEGSGGRPGDEPGAPRPGWDAGARAMREAARRTSTYVLVAEDPLAEVAAGWRAMWDLPGGPPAVARFEVQAAAALAAWRDKQFELPDYYLVVAPPQGGAAGPDLYLGPLRAIRPRRVAFAGSAGSAGQAGLLLDALRTLEHGPWWPPLDELLAAARDFYAGGLAETQGD